MCRLCPSAPVPSFNSNKLCLWPEFKGAEGEPVVKCSRVWFYLSGQHHWQGPLELQHIRYVIQIRVSLRGAKGVRGLVPPQHKCAFNKRTIKVFVSCSWWCPGTLHLARHI